MTGTVTPFSYTWNADRLLAQGTSELGLAASSGPCQQQVVAMTQQVTAGQGALFRRRATEHLACRGRVSQVAALHSGV